jgi:hypothetical protein
MGSCAKTEKEKRKITGFRPKKLLGSRRCNEGERRGE